MTATINQFIAHVTAQLGTSEQPLGSNEQPYGSQFGWDGVAWCAEFGWCMYQDAHADLPIKSASCVAVYDYAKAHGYLRADPRNAAAGDSVIRTWEHLSRAQLDPADTHYQVVVGVRHQADGVWLDLIGGNQGPGVVSCDTVRADDPSLLGVLAWSRLFGQAPPAKPNPQPGPLPHSPSHLYPTQILGPGATGALVRQLQQQLNQRVPHLTLTVDGQYGPATAAAVRAFQKMDRLDVDGTVGPLTWQKLYPAGA